MKIFSVLLCIFLVCCFIGGVCLCVVGITTTPEDIMIENGMDNVKDISEADVSDEGYMTSGYYYIDELTVLERYAQVTKIEITDADGFSSTEFNVNKYGDVVDEYYLVKFYDDEGKAYLASMVVESYDINNSLFNLENAEYPVKMQAYVEVGGTFDPVYQGKVSVSEYREESVEKFTSQEKAIETYPLWQFFADTNENFKSERQGFANTERIMYIVIGALFMLPGVIMVISVTKKTIKKKKEAA